MIKTALIFLGLVFVASPVAALARDIHVDPVSGNDPQSSVADTESGLSHERPIKSIQRALELAKPGDTIHISPQNQRLRQSIRLHNIHGEPGKPITIDGQGVTLNGCDPINAAEWQSVGNGLYFNEKLLTQQIRAKSLLQRFFVVFNGRVERMGRSSKGARAAFKKPEELKAGEWTIDAETNRVYLRVNPNVSLDRENIEIPVRENGVGLNGGNSHIVIKNITAERFWNDGFNLHGKSRDIHFDNIRSHQCGDDGFSAHDDCQSSVNRFAASENSTGICNIGRAVTSMNSILLVNNTAFEFYALGETRYDISNMIIESRVSRPLVMLGNRKNDANDARVHATMNHVLIAHRGEIERSVEILSAANLSASNITTVGLSWRVDGAVNLQKSWIAARSGSQMDIEKLKQALTEGRPGAQVNWETLPPKPSAEK